MNCYTLSRTRLHEAVIFVHGDKSGYEWKTNTLVVSSDHVRAVYRSRMDRVETLGT